MKIPLKKQLSCIKTFRRFVILLKKHDIIVAFVISPQLSKPQQFVLASCCDARKKMHSTKVFFYFYFVL